MERRHITFIFLAASLLLLFNLLSAQRQQEDRQARQQQEAVEEEADTPRPAPTDAQLDVPADLDQPQDDQQREVQTRKFATLGSVDPADGYRMLVTLDSRGASVHRVELSNPSYQSYEHDDEGGYLGRLALQETNQQGVRIGVVGPGTPAARARLKEGDGAQGLQADDVIVAIDDTSVSSLADLRAALRPLGAGREVQVVVQRATSADPNAETESLTYLVNLAQHPVEVIKPESTLTPSLDGGPPQWVDHPPSYLTTLAQVGVQTARPGAAEIPGLPSLINENWKTTQVSENEVHFELTLVPADLSQIGPGRQLRLVKKFRLMKVDDETSANDGFHIDYDLEIHNESEETLDVAYKQLGATGLPLEGWWYIHKISRGFGTAGVRDVTWESADGHFRMFTVYNLVEQAEKEGTDRNTPLYNLEQNPGTKYAGVDSHYFNSSLLLNHEESNPRIELARASAFPVGPINPEYHPRTDCTFSLESRPIPIPAGGSATQSFQIFAGPKKSGVLTHYGLSEVEYYGWFGGVSWVLLKVLHLLYTVLGNYGLAIIVLTLIVRGAMYPISRKQAKNMMIQQELAPEIKRLSEQYKDKPEERLRAQQELFKKHNFNPLGGCLMMFIQLPIFLGLYRGLAVDFELRQAPLIPGISWCSNLAAPDQLWYWGHIMPEFITRPTGFLSLGPYLNILPLVTVVLFLVQQKLFMPPPQDEQQAIQQRMMTFMMLFMGIIFFKVPSGLCIYFITSSIWGIVERKMLPKPKLHLPAASTSDTPKKQPKVRPVRKKK